MNASNNLALAPRSTTVVNHDSHAMNEPATKQDLHNQGILTDSEFVKVDSRFANVDNQITNLRTDMNAGLDRVDSQISNLRTDMDAKFDKAQVALNKTFFKFGSLCFTMMFAVLSVDRWWR